MKWITSTHLNHWADNHEAQGLFPYLVRRLILASNSLVSLRFPVGDTVWMPGYDGVLETTTSSLFVPCGKSVWEFGCGITPKTKADSDYKKRSEEPLNVVPEETEFIFVTPRTFVNKQEWIEEKKPGSSWKDIRIYDAIDLECWLEDAPAVGAWLAKQLNIFTTDIVAIEDRKEEWKSISDPPIPIEIVLPGREPEMNAIMDWLREEAPSIKSVQAQTKKEAILFLIASALTLSQEEADKFFSCSLIVKTPETFRQLILFKRPLVLIPDFETEENLFTKAVKTGHFVYIPLDPQNTVQPDRLILSRLDRDGFINCLKKSGFSEVDANKLNRETGRSLSVLERKVSGAVAQPFWAQSEQASDLIPILFAGCWDESKSGDKEILASLAQAGYSDIQRRCTDLISCPDTPVYNIGLKWRLVSPVDAWSALGGFITQSELDCFRQIAIKVLSQRNPALDLEEEKRWMASLYDKDPPYSSLLQEGLCQSLILIAIYGENFLRPLNAPQQWVNQIVRELLYDVPADRWLSLSNVMIFLAEAAPDTFLTAIEQSFQGDDPAVMKLFADTPESLGAPSYHANILWALEILAWDVRYFERAVFLLSKMARNDRGTKVCNRPLNSLREIFIPWQPQTSVSFVQRKLILERLASREPLVGWRLMLRLLPEHNSMMSPTGVPRWRELNTCAVPVTVSDFETHSSAILAILLDTAGVDSSRWAELLQKVSHLPCFCNRVVERLKTHIADVMESDQNVLWATIRELLWRVRTFKEVDWALPAMATVIEDLDKIYIDLKPSLLEDRFLWLFESYDPHFPDGEVLGKREEKAHRTQEARRSAIQQMLGSGGISLLVEFCKKVSLTVYIGNELARLGLSREDETVLFGLLLSEHERLRTFAIGYIGLRAGLDNTWIDLVLQRIEVEEWSDVKITRWFLALTPTLNVWTTLNGFSDAIRSSYWQSFNSRLHGEAAEVIAYAVDRLLEVNRSGMALHLAGPSSDKLCTEQIVATLFCFAKKAKQDDIDQMDQYDVLEVFEVLRGRSDLEKDQRLQLEWVYLPLLCSESSQVRPIALEREIAANSAFFAGLIQNTHRAENEPPSNEISSPDEQTEILRQRSHALLECWCVLPGTVSDEKDVEYEQLYQWVLAAREMCREVNRLRPCDHRIGSILAKASYNKDAQVWPPEYVCKLIEVLENENVERSFCVQIFNNRGSTRRSPGEGGTQERELVAKYRTWASLLVERYPRTARCLNSMGDRYECEAKRFDETADWDSLAE